MLARSSRHASKDVEECFAALREGASPAEIAAFVASAPFGMVGGGSGGVVEVTTDEGVANGGAERDRTVDLLNAIQALSQLSYGPRCRELREGTETNAVGASKFPLRGRILVDSQLRGKFAELLSA